MGLRPSGKPSGLYKDERGPRERTDAGEARPEEGENPDHDEKHGHRCVEDCGAGFQLDDDGGDGGEERRGGEGRKHRRVAEARRAISFTSSSAPGALTQRWQLSKSSFEDCTCDTSPRRPRRLPLALAPRHPLPAPPHYRSPCCRRPHLLERWP